jgi:predicted O-methyltransferase YrrM
MTQETWTAVDRYFDDLLAPEDEALTGALAASDAAGLPKIQVTASQGKLLHLLARSIGARRILEIGTLGGYSTIWLARALPPGGRLVTLEAVPLHADVARANVERAGLADRVDVRLGKALDTLPEIEQAGLAPFDLVFVDADKPNIPEYFDWALKLARPGSLIIVDNVVREGAVADGASEDASVLGVRRLATKLAAEPRASATVVQTVGGKGYDGFILALVTGAL